LSPIHYFKNYIISFYNLFNTEINLNAITVRKIEAAPLKSDLK